MQRLVCLFTTLALSVSAAAQVGPGTGKASIPYQGYLERDGVAADGLYDLRFGLYTSAGADASGLVDQGAGAAWWDELTDVSVYSGRFSVQLGQGAAIDESLFFSDELYVAVAVREAGSSAAFIVLDGLQRLGQVPFAVRGEAAKGLDARGTTTITTDSTIWTFSGHDLHAAATDRNAAGRVFAVLQDDRLAINYAGDFASGTVVASDLDVSGDTAIAGEASIGQDLTVEGRISTNTLRIPNNTGTLNITDDDGENIVAITEAGTRARVELKDNEGTDLFVKGTVAWQCPGDMTRLGTYCIDNAVRRGNWTSAATTCHNEYKMLCSIDVLMLCDSIEPSTSACTDETDDGTNTDVIWSSGPAYDDFSASVYSEIATYNGDDNSIDRAGSGDTNNYFCCVPGYFAPVP